MCQSPSLRLRQGIAANWRSYRVIWCGLVTKIKIKLRNQDLLGMVVHTLNRVFTEWSSKGNLNLVACT